MGNLSASPSRSHHGSPLEFRRRGGFNIASTNPIAYYDRTVLASMFQYSVGFAGVSGAAQPIGLGLDLSQGAQLDAALIKESTVTITGSVSWVGNTATMAASSASNMRFSLADLTNAGLYEITLDVKSISDLAYVEWAAKTAYTLRSTGLEKFYAYGGATYTDANRHLQLGSYGACVIEVVSVRLVKGNHQLQATNEKRPLTAGSPIYADFDADDELITTFPASLGAGCTVCRSLPSTGASITTGVTLTATYTDNVDAHFLAIYTAAQWAALDAGQIANITKLLNQKAGVSPLPDITSIIAGDAYEGIIVGYSKEYSGGEFGNVGSKLPAAGEINNYEVLVLMSVDFSGITMNLVLKGLVLQDAFTTITVDGVTYATADASYIVDTYEPSLPTTYFIWPCLSALTIGSTYTVTYI